MAKPQAKEGPYIEFGRWLRECRESRFGVNSQSQVELIAKTRRKPLPAEVKQGKLTHIERGWNGDPTPELLWSLSELYGVPYKETAARWLRVRNAVQAQRFGLETKDVTTDDLGQEQSRTTQDDIARNVEVSRSGSSHAQSPAHGGHLTPSPDLLAQVDPFYRERLSETLSILGAFVVDPSTVDLGRALAETFRPPRRQPPAQRKRRARDV